MRLAILQVARQSSQPALPSGTSLVETDTHTHLPSPGTRERARLAERRTAASPSGPNAFKAPHFAKGGQAGRAEVSRETRPPSLHRSTHYSTAACSEELFSPTAKICNSKLRLQTMARAPAQHGSKLGEGGTETLDFSLKQNRLQRSGRLERAPRVTGGLAGGTRR